MHVGKMLDTAYTSENLELARVGCCNLQRHIENASKYGIPVVVAINRFISDTDAELDVVKEEALKAGNPPSWTILKPLYCNPSNTSPTIGIVLWFL